MYQGHYQEDYGTRDCLNPNVGDLLNSRRSLVTILSVLHTTFYFALFWFFKLKQNSKFRLI